MTISVTANPSEADTGSKFDTILQGIRENPSYIKPGGRVDCILASGEDQSYPLCHVQVHVCWKQSSVVSYYHIDFKDSQGESMSVKYSLDGEKIRYYFSTRRVGTKTNYYFCIPFFQKTPGTFERGPIRALSSNETKRSDQFKYVDINALPDEPGVNRQEILSEAEKLGIPESINGTALAEKMEAIVLAVDEQRNSSEINGLFEILQSKRDRSEAK